MAREEPKTPQSLSERLRSHWGSSSREITLDDHEPGIVEAMGERPEQERLSTIARVMSECSPGVAPQSRGTVLVHQILENVEEHPGCDVHQLASWLGEKSIFILSHVDDLTREGVLLRLDNGRLYRSRDFLPVEEEAQASPNGDEDEGRRALQQVERTKIFLHVFRFLTSELGVEPECGRKMIVQVNSGKFFEMRAARGGVNISLYGMFPKELVERFKRDSDFERQQINYSRLTGIVDIRGCRYQDLESILPWVAEFYKTQSACGGGRGRV